MRVREVKGDYIEKNVQFEEQPGMNSNTWNSRTEDRNSVTSYWVQDAGTITATGKIVIYINWLAYYINVEKI